MRIEMLETFIHDGRRLTEGETVKTEDSGGTLADAVGLMLVQNGFAKDLDEVVETGERPKPGQPVVLEVDGMRQGHAAENAG